MITIFGVSTLVVCLYWVFLVFLPTYAVRQLHLATSDTFFSTTVAGVIYVVVTPFFGALSDRIGRKPILFASALSTIALSYPLFLLLISFKSVTGLVLAQAIATLVMTLPAGVACAVYAEAFPTRVRYTALSVSYGLSVAIFGGFAPFIATALIGATGNAIAPAYYVIASAIACFIATFFVREGSGKPLLE